MAELIGDIFRGDSWNFPVRLLPFIRAVCSYSALQPLNDTADRKFAHQREISAGRKGHSDFAHKF
jgi:hypothetical protein